MKRVEANPNILGGKPVVEGTRLSVEHILGLLANGMSHAEIIESYPEFDEADIYSVLDYAAKALRNDIFVDVVSTSQAE